MRAALCVCRYGNQIVSQLPETALKLSDWEKHLCALCFTSQETIPRFIAMGQVDVLVPPPGNTLAAEALSALARALAETNEVRSYAALTCCFAPPLGV